jgi:hypothetical protein
MLREALRTNSNFSMWLPVTSFIEFAVWNYCRGIGGYRVFHCPKSPDSVFGDE